MPFLDWVNKRQAKESTRAVPYHLLKQESIYGDVSGANADNLQIQGDNLLALKALLIGLVDVSRPSAPAAAEGLPSPLILS